VKEFVCAFSGTVPGGPAWRADIRPGDRVVKIDDSDLNRQLYFDDLKAAVSFGSSDDGIRFLIKRRGTEELVDLLLKPEPASAEVGNPTIGVMNEFTTTIRGKSPFWAVKTDGEFKSDDKIVEVEGVAVETQEDIESLLVKHVADAVKLTIERPVEAKEQGKVELPERLVITVQPRPRLTLGLVMKFGPITAVQNNSPAKAAGFEPGDVITTIDGRDVSTLNPMTLGDMLRGRAGEKIAITVLRSEKSAAGKDAKKETTYEREVTLRDVDWDESPVRMLGPTTIPALGIAYDVTTTVQQVEPGSPAAQAEWKLDPENKDAKGPAETKLAPGAVVATAEIIPNDPKDADPENKEGQGRKFEFAEKKANWPIFVSRLQQIAPTSRVKLTLADGRTAEFRPVVAPGQFNVERGLDLKPELVIIQTDSYPEAFKLGFRKTKESALMVYSFLRSLIGGKVSSESMGGVGSIATFAAKSANDGLSSLLIFLTVMGANLAVINMLPIPVLDGGHMVFLAWEGITGKPPNEHVQGALTWLGLGLILFLMIYVNGLDVRRLIHWLME
jgi:regulator of sigma E protease